METDYQHAGENYSMLLAETSQSMEYYHLMRGICYEQTGEYRSAVEDVITSYSIHYTKLYDSSSSLMAASLFDVSRNICVSITSTSSANSDVSDTF